MSKATLTKRLEFCSSHRYHNPKWDDAKNHQVFGPCNNPNTHGHNYLLEVTLCGEIDPVTGMIINLYDLKQYLWDVLIEFDHKNLNLDTPYFTNRIPTTENLSLTLWERLARHPQLPALDRIRLYEDDTLYAEVTKRLEEESQHAQTDLQVTITRKYDFSSSVNISPTQMTGHNYAIGITIAGPIDPETGQIINLEQLDQLVHATVIERLSNKNMCLDPEFRNSTPTEENIAKFIEEALAEKVPQGMLALVSVSQNSRSMAMYRAS